MLRRWLLYLLSGLALPLSAFAQVQVGGSAVQIGGSYGGSGTVTNVATGTGLTGGPISTTGTIAFAAIAADSFWLNATGSSGVPSAIAFPPCSGATNALTYNTSTHTLGCNTISGGSMTWPSGGAGIPNYTGSSAWGTSYSASNAIPANFLAAIPLTGLATQAANTVLGNATGSTATPAALAMPSCSGPVNALAWVSGSGFACNSITTANLPGGALGSLPYQSSAGTTAMLAAETTNGTYVEAEVVSASAPVAPSWVNLATYLASPPAIGGTAPAAGTFTSVTVNGSGPSQVTLKPQTYAVLTGTYSCSGTTEGMMASLSDANTTTWGATVSSGGGSSHILVRCNGTNWTVVGI